MNNIKIDKIKILTLFFLKGNIFYLYKMGKIKISNDHRLIDTYINKYVCYQAKHIEIMNY